MHGLRYTYLGRAIVSWCWPSFVMNTSSVRLKFFAKVCCGINFSNRYLRVSVPELNVKEDVAGATFMAMATSSPELFINCVGTFITEGDIGVGTVVGSAVFNILAVPACCGIFASSAIQLDWWSVTRDCIFYGLSVIALIAVIYDHQIMWYEAACLVAAYGVYLTCK